MYYLLPYKFFIHESFGLGIIMSEENHIKHSEQIDVFFFESKSPKTMVKAYLLDSCKEVTNPPKLSEIIIPEFINQIYDSWTQTKGSKYVSDSRISIVYEDNYRVEATVIGTYKYYVSVQITDGVLSIKCSCPVESECKHSYALLKYLSLRYSGASSEEQTPFEIEFSKLLYSNPKEYFDQGFEIIEIFKERPETNSKSIYRFLNDYDYYSNKAFIPLVMNEEVYKELIDNANYDQRVKFNKIYQRYEKAADGRNYSLDDIILALIFKKRFEEIFTKNFNAYYRFSSLSREGIVFAAKKVQINTEIAVILSKVGLTKEEAIELFNLTKDKASKRLILMSYQEYFTDLTEEDLKELEYTVEDIFTLFSSSHDRDKPSIVLKNYHLFIKNGKDEYLPGMILKSLIYSNLRNYFNDLYQIIESLKDNALLLKVDFKKERVEIDQIKNRWRNLW